MVIRDLKEIIAKAEAEGCTDDTLVVMASDTEGNRIRVASDSYGVDYWNEHEEELYDDHLGGTLPRCLTLRPE